MILLTAPRSSIIIIRGGTTFKLGAGVPNGLSLTPPPSNKEEGTFL